ncbi:MAG TPA: M13 family metallopeptidase, partial [Thermoanaerobaculia bacterium]|nr:M13 family metallopeptidase [Thermoanaerobaculia bacterium]
GAAAGGALPAPAAAARPAASTGQRAVADLLAAMDRSADPCSDFYQYACGAWREATPLPADKPAWVRSFSTIHERNREILRGLIEQAAANPAASADHARVGRYYGACMDTAAREKKGIEPLAPYLAAIAAVENRADLMRLTGELYRLGVEPLFGFGVLPDFQDPDTEIALAVQGGLGMPDRDYYLSDDAKKKELMAAYQEHVAAMLRLLGEEAGPAAEQAAAVVAFETELAHASRTAVAMREIDRLYNKIDRAGLQKLTPELPWDAFFAGLGHPGVQPINVATPEFFTALDAALAAATPETLAAYLRWHLVAATAERLPERFGEESFAFYGKKLQGAQEREPRWKRCVAATEGALGEVVGRLYVEQHFAGDSKQIAQQMIDDIEAAFATSLPQLGWMDDATRAKALEKMRAVGNKIGYPERWQDYSSLTLGGDHFVNAAAAAAFEVDEAAAKIGKPVDPTEWGMTPQTVNAYYSGLRNEIAFPAGILQPPFFHRDFPAAMNYGAIGAVMGHELTHGFDDKGRKYDPSGQVRAWWAPQVVERFEERAQCVRDLYSGYEVEPGVSVQGALTSGENIADIGGLKQAHSAYRLWKERQAAAGAAPAPAPGGLTDEQLFFVAFGQVWCSVASPEYERLRVSVDPHSPHRFRVRGPVSNNPAFAAAFGCEAGTPMAPADRCEVW